MGPRWIRVRYHTQLSRHAIDYPGDLLVVLDVNALSVERMSGSFQFTEFHRRIKEIPGVYAAVQHGYKQDDDLSVPLDIRLTLPPGWRGWALRIPWVRASVARRVRDNVEAIYDELLPGMKGNPE